ncbi:hydrogenase accessory protein HypB [Helicobacter sp. 16-1353]|nr:hydrogenase accessory protein HypB [Helicobacter sp. 16-1353]
MREIYKKDNLYVINLMSSPGSGKTTLLEAFAKVGRGENLADSIESKTLADSTRQADFVESKIPEDSTSYADLKNTDSIDSSFRFAVIEGDLETNRDAERLQKHNINAYQITTGDACHLEAAMIEKAYFELDSSGAFKEVDFLFIENVGNLVCPASYDLGEHLNMVLLSAPEGDDKVLKYPTMFLKADVVVVTKSDIMEYFDFKIESVKKDLEKLNPKAELFVVSMKEPQSVKNLIEFIKKCSKK